VADLHEAVQRLAALMDAAITAREDVSMNQIALYADVSNGYLSRIRRGMLSHPPSPEILKRLAPHLRVSYNELLRTAGYITSPRDIPEEMGVFLRAQRELADDDFRELVNYALYQLHKTQQKPESEAKA
jgi:transcriptional regulator with XRE-family HTH domain